MHFCTMCFASERNGSWGCTTMNNYCLNCGAGGTTVEIPEWAIENIRKNASWVGKRYYPCDEDRNPNYDNSLITNS